MINITFVLKYHQTIRHILKKKDLGRDTPDPGDKPGVEAGGQMGFYLIHAAILIILYLKMYFYIIL